VCVCVRVLRIAQNRGHSKKQCDSGSACDNKQNRLGFKCGQRAHLLENNGAQSAEKEVGTVLALVSKG